MICPLCRAINDCLEANKQIIAIAVEAVHWRREFKDACPDVGWGESLETSIDKVTEAAGAFIDTNKLVEAYKLKYGKR
jgi:hypothetical protein